MTNWDERAARVRAEAERKEQEIEAKRRAEEARRDEAWNKLVDVAAWAIKRYQAVGIEPVPIEAYWHETVKIRWGETRKKKCSIRLLVAFPLFNNSSYSSDDYGKSWYANFLLLASPDMNFSHHFFTSDYPNPPPPGKIEFPGRNLQEAPQRVIEPLARWRGEDILLSIAPGRDHRDVDSGCDEIAAYVAALTDPTTRR